MTDVKSIIDTLPPETIHDKYIIEDKYVLINKSPNVKKYIKHGNDYILELPETKTHLILHCTFAAINACDMVIKSVFKDGKEIIDDEEYTISYNYSNYDTIYYRSFSYKENCLLYGITNEIIS